MQSAKQQVVNLIHAYQAAVYQAVTLLNAKSAQDKGFQQHQQSPGVWAGYLDSAQQVSYRFHGVGCWITTPAFTVDFDYDLEGGVLAWTRGLWLIFYKETLPSKLTTLC
jgi:hypothetical protein